MPDDGIVYTSEPISLMVVKDVLVLMIDTVLMNNIVSVKNDIASGTECYS